ncbi:MAG: SpoIIE family protein phosphatase [Clostridia bacterium]|nr:SpoIIE family protein phosphatase [Clostridia bacterium]
MTETKETEKLENYLEDKNKSSDTERLKKIAVNLAVAFVAFCFSQGNMLSVMSPFAHAFLGAVPYRWCVSAFVGSVTGYLSAFSGTFTVRSVICLLFICLSRLLIHKRLPDYDGGKVERFIVFFSVTSGAVLQSVFTGYSFKLLILAITEGGLAFCGTYFFSRSLRTPVARIGISGLTTGDRLSLGISVCAFVACFSGISVEGFSPARLLCCFVLCVASYCKGVSAGSVLGNCFGVSLCFSASGSYVFPAFAVSGLISGVFSPVGQIAVGISQCLSFCVVCVLSAQGENFLLPIMECGVAAAAFMIISPVHLTGITEFARKNGVVRDEDVNLQVSALLKKASGNVYSFCKTVDEVSTRLDRVINPEVNKLFFDIQQNVCDGCSRKSMCWNSSFDSTAGDILAIMGIERRGKGKLKLEKECMRLHELKRQLSHSKAQYSLSMIAKMKSREMRCILTEQFSGMGDFLGELSEKIAKSRTADPAKSTALRAIVIDKGVYIDSLSCFDEYDGRVCIEINCFERPFETDYKRIKGVLEEATSRSFDEPEISVTELGTLIRFEEKAVFTIIVGSAQRPIARDAPCGDSVAFCKRNEASRAVLLSDGMGTGSSAALDSKMAVSLTEKLLSAGFSFESSVKIVNSSLIMKSTDESMATMDGLNINLFTGEAEFYKAGAAISFVRSDRDVFIVEESSLPLGILRQVRYSKSVYKLQNGDIVLMVSDGITAEDCGWINDELLSWSTNNMDDLACHIVELAALRQDRYTGDDLTAVAVKLVKNR